ncbi:hypothetical protein FRC09_009553 [Ceratobasidium sp. 395]|nr:hypothetical protein FRC09_009553 [Ceratobasidium sp. 395]
MSATQTTAPQLSASEGTTYIPFKPRKRRTTSEHDPKARGQNSGNTNRPDWGSLHYRLNKAVFQELEPTIGQLVDFARQDRIAQDSEFGLNEIPTALVVGRDRALISALLSKAVRVSTNLDPIKDTDEEYASRGDSESNEDRARGLDPSSPGLLVVRIDEGDCSNITSALRALVGGFVSQFEETDAELPTKKKSSTTLAPFDMARLVTSYEDYHKSQKKSPNLIVVYEQLETFDTEVMQSLIYICSKHLDSLPISFIATASDSSYLQHAFTTATRTMLDTTIFQPPSGPALCLSVLQRTLSPALNQSQPSAIPPELILGETSIRVLKDIINRTDGCIDALTTTLQLIHLEHYWYQKAIFDAADAYLSKAKPLFEAEAVFPGDLDDKPKLGSRITVEPDDLLLAFLTLSKRKGPLANGFSPMDVNAKLTKYDFYKQVEQLDLISRPDKTDKSRYALSVLYHLTWGFYELGAYRQEIPLTFLDLLELEAKGSKEVEKYAAWMLKKGFESAPAPDLANIVQNALDRVGEPGSRSVGRMYDIHNTLKEIVERGELDQEYRARFRNRLVIAVGKYTEGSDNSSQELFVTQSTSGLKELLDPTPRSVILSGLIRPGAYFRCECCDPEESHIPENMAQMPDTCALFQRSLDAGRLLNIADWFGAFVNITQNERVSRTVQQPEPVRTSRSTSRTRRATSSVHLESDADAEGEIDEALEAQQGYQARFLQSAHELEFLGLIQATGRRKEHVLRTVFETGD